MKILQSSYILLIVVSCSTHYVAHATPIDNRQNAALEEHQQPQEDLKRITSSSSSSNSTSSNSAAAAAYNTSDELTDEASSNLLSVLGDLDGAPDVDSMRGQLLQSEGSHLLTMGLLPGKRRFDDNTALASTGQVRGNRFVMPESSTGTLGAERSRLSNINEALLDDPRLEGRRLKMMGSQRRDMADMIPAGMMQPAAERRQLNIRPRVNENHRGADLGNYLHGGFKPQQAASGHGRRAGKPRADPDEELDREVEGQGADIFKDDAEDARGSDKRADVQANGGADSDGDDDADDEADETRANQRGVQNFNLKPNGFASADARALEQRFRAAELDNPMRGIEDAAAAAAGYGGAGDEDSESTNLKAKKSRPAEAVEVVVNERDAAKLASAEKRQRDNADDKLLSANLSGDDDEHSAASQPSGAADLQTAAGHHHGHSHGHYYQYAGSPKKKAWKFGFKRGNHKHMISREEKGYKNKFHSSFKWHAKEKCKKHHKCESKGKMTWHYEHHDKKKHHHY